MAKGKLWIILAIVVSLMVASLAACAKKEAAEPGAVTVLAATSVDERGPAWSPDGTKIFFKSDEWLRVCSPDGSRCENLTQVEGSFVFSQDMQRVFYKKTSENWTCCIWGR